MTAVILVEDLGEFESGDGVFDAGGAVGPELLLDVFETAEMPLADDGGVEVAALFGVGGVVLGVVFRLELGEGFGRFTGDDDGLGIESGFEGVPGRTGLAFFGLRSGGVLCVETVRDDLGLSGHRYPWLPWEPT
jgi:hypothetical protein